MRQLSNFKQVIDYGEYDFFADEFMKDDKERLKKLRAWLDELNAAFREYLYFIIVIHMLHDQGTHLSTCITDIPIEDGYEQARKGGRSKYPFGWYPIIIHKFPSYHAYEDGNKNVSVKLAARDAKSLTFLTYYQHEYNEVLVNHAGLKMKDNLLITAIGEGSDNSTAAISLPVPEFCKHIDDGKIGDYLHSFADLFRKKTEILRHYIGIDEENARMRSFIQAYRQEENGFYRLKQQIQQQEGNMFPTFPQCPQPMYYKSYTAYLLKFNFMSKSDGFVDVLPRRLTYKELVWKDGILDGMNEDGGKAWKKLRELI